MGRIICGHFANIHPVFLAYMLKHSYSPLALSQGSHASGRKGRVSLLLSFPWPDGGDLEHA